MKYDNAQTSLEAVDLGIKSFAAYAAQLIEFDKKTKEEVDRLGQSHQDQNYEKYCNFFEPVWAKLIIFKQEIDEFQHYLEAEKKEIEEYIKTGNKPIM